LPALVETHARDYAEQFGQQPGLDELKEVFHIAQR